MFVLYYSNYVCCILLVSCPDPPPKKWWGLGTRLGVSGYETTYSLYYDPGTIISLHGSISDTSGAIFPVGNLIIMDYNMYSHILYYTPTYTPTLVLKEEECMEREDQIAQCSTIINYSILYTKSEVAS